jgi:hypothetical protein
MTDISDNTDGEDKGFGELTFFGENGIQKFELSENYGKALVPVKKLYDRPSTRFNKKGEAKDHDLNEFWGYFLADSTTRYCYSITSNLIFAYGYQFDMAKPIEEELDIHEQKYINFLNYNWKDKVNLNNQLGIIQTNGGVFGDYYAEIVYDERGAYPQGWGVQKIKHLDPRTVHSDRTAKGRVNAYYQHPNLTSILPSSIKRSPRSVRLGTPQMIHIKYSDFLNKTYGISQILTLLDTIDMKMGLKGDAVTIAQRYASPFLVWSIGSADRIFPNNVILEAKNLIESQFSPNNSDIFAPGFINVKPIGMDGANAGTQLLPLIQYLDEEIAAGLGVPDIFIGGNSSSEAAQAKMEIFVRQIKAYQQFIATELRNQLFVNLVYPPENKGTKTTPKWVIRDLTPQEYEKVPILRFNAIETIADMRLKIKSMTDAGVIGSSEIRKEQGLRGKVNDDDHTPANQAKLKDTETKRIQVEEQAKAAKLQPSTQGGQNPPSKSAPKRKTPTKKA